MEIGYDVDNLFSSYKDMGLNFDWKLRFYSFFYNKEIKCFREVFWKRIKEKFC